MTRVSMTLFGQNSLALRLFPSIFGTLTLVGVYRLARHLFDRPVAFIALPLAFFSPWPI
ncbi:MAG: glycosyltransferase family 39 protein [Candidatus Oleimicrobiaceae bacterium]